MYIMLTDILSQCIDICREEIKKDPNKKFLHKDIMEPAAKYINDRAYPYVLTIIVLFVVIILIMSINLYLLICR